MFQNQLQAIYAAAQIPINLQGHNTVDLAEGHFMVALFISCLNANANGLGPIR